MAFDRRKIGSLKKAATKEFRWYSAASPAIAYRPGAMFLNNPASIHADFVWSDRFQVDVGRPLQAPTTCFGKFLNSGLVLRRPAARLYPDRVAK